MDPQQGTQWTPSGVKRISPVERKERFSTLTFTWWFMDGPLLVRSGRERLLRILSRDLPEALPTRYGDHEPPQSSYSKSAEAQLLNFLDEHLLTGLRIVVWYPHWPVVGFHLSLPESAGGSPKGFRSNYLQIDIDRGVVSQAGWENQLRRFWLEMSQLVRPFYGDVRTLNGCVRRRGGYGSDRQTEQHPVRSWWWRGIPLALGHAVVLGTEYQRLWPAFVGAAKIQDGLAFASTEDWTKSEELAPSCGKTPKSLTAKPLVWPNGLDPSNAPVNTPDSYPEQWPFEAPFRKADR